MESRIAHRAEAPDGGAVSFRANAEWHAREAERPVKEKIAILLRLQREVLPILRSRRTLEPWERPWEIEP